MNASPGLSRAVAVAAALVLAAGTFAINSWRLRTFRVAGPLDMAYYNQQLWNMGRAPVTVRPQNFYATEGPDAWRTNHLRPITFALVPLYRWRPHPTTLYALQAAVLALGVIPAYRIGARYGDPTAAALAALTYAACPPLWLVGATDFRYMYLGIPIGLAVADWIAQQRTSRLVLGTAIWATIREPYCIVIAALGVHHALWQWPVRGAWRVGAIAIGLGIVWFWGHVLYLTLAYGPATAAGYLWAATHPTEAYGLVPGAVAAALRREWPALLVYFMPLAALGLRRPLCVALGLLLLLPPMRMGLFSLHPAVQYVRYICPALVLLLWAAVTSVAERWQESSRRHWSLALLATQLMALALIVTVGPGLLRRGAIRDGLLTFPSRYNELDVRAGLVELLKRIPQQEPVTAARGVLLNVSPRTVLYDYYQPGPGLDQLAVARNARWLVVEKKLFLLDGPVPRVAEAVWQSLRRTAGSTGVRRREEWLRFVRWLRRARAGAGGWRVVYEGADLLVLRRTNDF